MMKLLFIAAVFANEEAKKADDKKEVTECKETKDCEKNEKNKKCIVKAAPVKKTEVEKDAGDEAGAKAGAEDGAKAGAEDGAKAGAEDGAKAGKAARRLSDDKKEDKKEAVECKDAKKKCEDVKDDKVKTDCANDTNCEVKEDKCVLREKVCECSATTASVFVALAALAMLF